MHLEPRNFLFSKMFESPKTFSYSCHRSWKDPFVSVLERWYLFPFTSWYPCIHKNFNHVFLRSLVGNDLDGLWWTWWRLIRRVPLRWFWCNCKWFVFYAAPPTSIGHVFIEVHFIFRSFFVSYLPDKFSSDSKLISDLKSLKRLLAVIWFLTVTATLFSCWYFSNRNRLTFFRLNMMLVYVSKSRTLFFILQETDTLKKNFILYGKKLEKI